MIRRWLFAVLTLALVSSAGAASFARPADYPPELPWPAFPTIRFQHGDDPRWAAPDFDDSGWQQISGYDLPSRAGIYWVRLRVKLRDTSGERPPDGLLLKIVASYEVYWDGRLIGRNGAVGASAEQETPGYVDALFQIPAGLLEPGEHVLALRMSSFHTGFPGPTYGLLIFPGNFRTILVQRSRTAMFSLMAVGAALVVAVVFGLMWLLAGRRFSLLLFSVLFLCVALMQALQAWRWLFEYPYHWHYPRLLAITGLTTAMAALLPAFVMHHFGIGRRRWIYAALAIALTAVWFRSDLYNVIGLEALGIGFLTALALASHAMWRRRRGAVFVWAGLAASVFALIAAPRDFLDHAFFISAGPAVLGLLIALVLQLRDERREAQAALLTAARLETELLKRNLQPHFLLNTLATIQEVIEHEPRTAVTMIDALANEFRLLSAMSGEKLVELGQELQLCRAHLQVMSLRKGARCTLAVQGADERALVPPALFHTLIENGLTHLLPREGELAFELRAEQRAGATRYVLRAKGEREPAAKAVPAREGTGLRYIKARLEESFTGRWSLASRAVAEGWETEIEIAGEARSRARDGEMRPGAAAVPGSSLA